VKTFPHWRNVGRAMRWARRQEGLQGPEIFDRPFGRRYLWGWFSDGQTVSVNVTWGIGFAVKLRGPRSMELDGRNAAETLRVLAALDLIPADIAYAADERYGRCEVPKCGLLAKWCPAEAGAKGRWVHAEPWLVMGPNAHQPAIAESGTEHKDAS
jgi:hypothetical protein